MVKDFADQILWVLVADGEKSLLLANADTAAHPDLRILSAREIDNPPDRDQSASRPGRMNDGRAGGTHKSAFDDTDFHRLAKTEFAAEIAGRLNKAALQRAFDRIVIIAPPATLGELRQRYHTQLAGKIAAEIGKDLTRHPVEDIEKAVAEALAG
ncbi:MAG TPA: host attachment family protein [Parvularculaceae bacterium]|nr:host attachment family protein [Parvularculaceae bacterium]